MTQYVVHIFELLIGKAEQLHRKQSLKQAIIFSFICVCVCVCLRQGLLCCPGWDTLAGSVLTAALTSWAYMILQPQPPQVVVTTVMSHHAWQIFYNFFFFW
uniref:Uncharacterized protein n=1 Tax=Piliocolobus tephrosceles TaxID=591936 RepID=A0A8C9IWE3_9PRIM